MKRAIGLTQRVSIVESYGERRDCLDQAWTVLLARAGYLPVPIPNRTSDMASFVDALGLQGLVLTGGNDLEGLAGAENIAPERDALEHTLLDLAAVRKIPVLAVCRGLQMLIVHYGGMLQQVQVQGHVAHDHAIVVATGAPDVLAECEAVNSFHNFGAWPDDVGTELEVLATASDGSVEAARHSSLPQFGIMWHPERPPHGEHNTRLLDFVFSNPSP